MQGETRPNTQMTRHKSIFADFEDEDARKARLELEEMARLETVALRAQQQAEEHQRIRLKLQELSARVP